MANKSDQFKCKWWAVQIALMPPGVIGLLICLTDFELFETDTAFFSTLIPTSILGWLTCMYFCWEPQNCRKSLKGFCEALRLKQIGQWLVILFTIFGLWLGVGVGLFCLPLWFDIDNSWGGILQMIGIGWVFIVYNGIMGFKSK